MSLEELTVSEIRTSSTDSRECDSPWARTISPESETESSGDERAEMESPVSPLDTVSREKKLELLVKSLLGVSSEVMNDLLSTGPLRSLSCEWEVGRPRLADDSLGQLGQYMLTRRLDVAHEGALAYFGRRKISSVVVRTNLGLAIHTHQPEDRYSETVRKMNNGQQAS